MKNLLKADLFRIIKSKITVISLIVAIVAPLLIVLMYFGIDRMVNVMTEGDVSMEDDMLMGYSLFNVRRSAQLDACLQNGCSRISRKSGSLPGISFWSNIIQIQTVTCIFLI